MGAETKAEFIKCSILPTTTKESHSLIYTPSPTYAIRLPGTGSAPWVWSDHDHLQDWCFHHCQLPAGPQRGQSPSRDMAKPWPSGRRFPLPAKIQGWGGRSDTVRDSHPQCSMQHEGDFFWKGRSLCWCSRSAGTPPAAIAEDGEVPSSVGVTGTSAVMARAVRSWSKGRQQREMQLMLKRCQRREAGSPGGAAPLSRHLNIINQQGCKAGLRARGRDVLRGGCFLPCSSHPPLCKHTEHEPVSQRFNPLQCVFSRLRACKGAVTAALLTCSNWSTAQALQQTLKCWACIHHLSALRKRKTTNIALTGNLENIHLQQGMVRRQQLTLSVLQETITQTRKLTQRTSTCW